MKDTDQIAAEAICLPVWPGILLALAFVLVLAFGCPVAYYCGVSYGVASTRLVMEQSAVNSGCAEYYIENREVRFRWLKP